MMTVNQPLNVKGSEPLTLNYQPRACFGWRSSAAARSPTSMFRPFIGFRTVKIVAVCDREPLMAKQIAERFGISACFSDLKEMLHAVSPDVVHITTPPRAIILLRNSASNPAAMSIWKNLSLLRPSETESLIQLARTPWLKNNRRPQLPVHSRDAGNAPARKARVSWWQADSSGKLLVVRFGRLDVCQCLSWEPQLIGLHQLPGQLFHNIISHGIAKLAEFLDDDVTAIVATAHRSEQLRSVGAEEVMDELRVMIRDKSGTTAFFCFSTQFRGLNQLRIYGPSHSVTADIITGTLIRQKTRSYKSYLTYFIPAVKNGLEHLRNARLNIVNFLRRRLYQDFGMKELIERFYNSIRKGARFRSLIARSS